MLKKCVIGLLFMPLLSLANSDHSGIYRDSNFNIMSYQGTYQCKIYAMPQDVSNIDDYSNKSIGDANMVVENEGDGSGKYIFINLNNGKDIDIPPLKLVEKGSTKTTYAFKSKSLTVGYILTSEEGAIVGIQDKTQGNELSVLLSNCVMLRNQEQPVPADPQ
ncbi:hypothetical protein M8G38_12820 [Providencia stuartii]|uniref:hypothetical protein n=1 Tax=Providencia stuartii TaxID=588 RepID=UPI00201DBA68|nr:hypothetical protein [Providencia stuartii]UQZ10681.1 hypothetical protein M8G38_12820 [Providencia stuartii]